METPSETQRFSLRIPWIIFYQVRFHFRLSIGLLRYLQPNLSTNNWMSLFYNFEKLDEITDAGYNVSKYLLKPR